MLKLHTLRHKFEDTIIQYEGEDMTMWDFATMQLSIYHSSHIATFSENEKRKKLSKLIECVTDIEGELIKVVSDAPTTKEAIHKYFNIKLFGSFEQMRVEMEIRYKA